MYTTNGPINHAVITCHARELRREVLRKMALDFQGWLSRQVTTLQDTGARVRARMQRNAETSLFEAR